MARWWPGRAGGGVADRRGLASGERRGSTWRRVGEVQDGDGAGAGRVLDRHGPGVGRTRPVTRRSPPTDTSAPSAPSTISSTATRSAARPLPRPPASTVVPRGSRAVARARSTTMPAGAPGQRAPPGTRAWAVGSQWLAASPAATRAGSSVGSTPPVACHAPTRASRRPIVSGATARGAPSAALRWQMSLSGRNRLQRYRGPSAGPRRPAGDRGARRPR